jgi:cyclopropane-fatty-acyl-phospholipid synthase
MEKHIFPGGYIPSLAEIAEPLERLKNDLHVVDVHNLRRHYALTLDHWSDRFEANVEEIRKHYGEAFVRKFRFYLRGSAASFRRGGILLYQVLLSNGYETGAPLTRHHFYGLEAQKQPVSAV